MTALDWREAAFVVDLSPFARRAWHAVERDTPTGKTPNMLGAVAAMLVRLLSERVPRWLVFAADVPGQTWRHELFADYKADRPPHPVGFDEQLVEVVRLLELHAIPVVGAPGHEADDVIATLVRSFRRAGIGVVILGGDKDLRQLVTDEAPAVRAWDGKGKVTGPAEVLETLGVLPERLGDLLALTGDDGDGVPGLRGVGPKKGAALLAGSEDLEDAIRLRRDDAGAAARALREGVETVRLARQLVALRDDVPLGLDLAACALGGYDLEGLRAWYEAHGMTGMGDRLRRSPMKRAPTDAQREAWERGDAVVPF